MHKPPHPTEPHTTDRLYAEEQGAIPRFVFDEKVVDVFPDMINRSVPGYSTILMMIGQLAGRYAQANSRCYDLGCSLGGATFAMANHIHKANINGVEIVAVDSSPAMVTRLQTLAHSDAARFASTQLRIVLADILDIDIQGASIVVLNFTLQFIPLEQRRALLRKIAEGMLPGAMLVLSEKITFENKQHDTLVNDMHHFFKASNGYSQMEIAQKRSALENVLIPETLATHVQRLHDCGFQQANVWFQCFNFVSLIATK
jgi:tRNA (cmo5U34)-methyltransferase